jgi:hypothetical protein
MRALGVLVLTALVAVSAAAAKDFRPGDLRVCNAKSCLAIADQDVLNAFASFYYGSPPPSRARAPRLRVPYFQLKYTNGYVTGIVATAQLDRFLSYGVNLGQFSRGRWYSVPSTAAAGLRELTQGLKPMRLTRTAVAKSR